MRKLLTACFSSAILAVTLVPATTSISQAKATYNVNKLQGEGFRACKAQGNNGYTAIVRGTTVDGRSFFDHGHGKFYVRSCFQTQAKCDHYVNTFTKRLAGVNEIDYTSCKKRG